VQCDYSNFNPGKTSSQNSINTQLKIPLNLALKLQLVFHANTGLTAVSGTVVKKKGIWRDHHGRWPNSIALIYAVPGHLLGLWLLVQPSALLLSPGVLLTAHTMVIGAYLVHECGHMTLFRSKKSMPEWRLTDGIRK
jgi:hypothetical protein